MAHPTKPIPALVYTQKQANTHMLVLTATHTQKCFLWLYSFAYVYRVHKLQSTSCLMTWLKQMQKQELTFFDFA